MSISPVVDRVRRLVEPILDELDLELFDLDYNGGILVVNLDRPGGADIDLIATATRAISRALDEHDPVPGRYTLEVSTPGLERTLRTPAHYRWAVGRDVAIKLNADAAPDAERRLEGVVIAAHDDAVSIRTGVTSSEVGELVLPSGGPSADEGPGELRRLAYADIERARSVFIWGPGPKPGQQRKGASSRPSTKPSTKKQVAP
jgi:ribosome maturation factor RimP